VRTNKTIGAGDQHAGVADRGHRAFQNNTHCWRLNSISEINVNPARTGAAVRDGTI
jgi:hypothetical protein